MLQYCSAYPNCHLAANQASAQPNERWMLHSRIYCIFLIRHSVSQPSSQQACYHPVNVLPFSISNFHSIWDFLNFSFALCLYFCFYKFGLNKQIGFRKVLATKLWRWTERQIEQQSKVVSRRATIAAAVKFDSYSYWVSHFTVTMSTTRLRSSS